MQHGKMEHSRVRARKQIALAGFSTPTATDGAPDIMNMVVQTNPASNAIQVVIGHRPSYSQLPGLLQSVTAVLLAVVLDAATVLGVRGHALLGALAHILRSVNCLGARLPAGQPSAVLVGGWQSGDSGDASCQQSAQQEQGLGGRHLGANWATAAEKKVCNCGELCPTPSVSLILCWLEP